MMQALIVTVCTAFLVTAGGAVAQMHMDHKKDTSDQSKAEGMSDMKKMGHGMMGHQMSKKPEPKMDHGDRMHDLHEKLQTLQAHSKRMEEVEDVAALRREMKNHMRMTDEIIQQIVDAMMSEQM